MKKIKDKVLKKEIFKPIQKYLMSDEFPWYYASSQVSDVTDSSFMFHAIYHKHKINSTFFGMLSPLLDYLNPISLINIRANLQLNRTNVDSHYHVDDKPGKTLKHKTAIFYVNTNNGYTEFEKDKEKVKSIENRIVIFPAQLSHRAVGQTDEDRRIVINFNFYDGS